MNEFSVKSELQLDYVEPRSVFRYSIAPSWVELCILSLACPKFHIEKY